MDDILLILQQKRSAWMVITANTVGKHTKPPMTGNGKHSTYKNGELGHGLLFILLPPSIAKYIG